MTVRELIKKLESLSEEEKGLPAFTADCCYDPEEVTDAFQTDVYAGYDKELSMSTYKPVVMLN